MINLCYQFWFGPAYCPFPRNRRINMNSYLHLLILSFVLSIFGPLQGQTPFFQDSKAEADVLQLSNGTSQNGVLDHFVRAIAEGSNKSPDRVRFIVAYERELKLARWINNQIKTKASIKNIGVTGDIQYKGFDFSDFLKPTRVSFNLVLQVGNQGAPSGVRKVYTFSGIDLVGDPANIAEFIHQDSSGQLEQHRLLLEDIKFSYQAEDKARFDQHTLLIDSYYQASKDLEVIYNELLAIQPDDLDRLAAHEQRALDLQQQIVTIQDKNYESHLGLNSGLDPARFVFRLRDCQSLSRELRTQISESIGVLPLLYYERALERLGYGQNIGAIQDLNTSIELDPGFAPSHYQLAVIAYQDGNIAESRLRLINILTKMQADPATLDQAAAMLGDMVKSDIGQARQLVQQNQFNKTLEILEPIGALCSDIPDLNCASEARDLIFKAHRGIYQSYLTGARQDLGAGRYEEAEKEAQRALEYQQQNGTVLSDGSEALQALSAIRRKVYQQKIQDAARLLDQQQLEQAENVVVSAIQLGEQYPEAIQSTSDSRQLFKRIKQEQYKALITMGHQDLQAGQFRKALDTLNKARSFEQSYGISADTLLWGMIQASALGIVKDDLTQAIQAAQSNRLTQARQLAQGASSMMSDYGLSEDKELLAMMDNLDESIFRQDCINAQNQFDGVVTEARGYEQNGDFIAAEGFYLKAIEVARQNQACGIDLKTVNSKSRELGPPAAYQKKVNEARSMVDRTSYHKAVHTYLDAGRDHEAFNLAKFGIAHDELIDFIMGVGQSGFLLYAVDHYMEAGDLETSLELTRTLAWRGLPKSEVKPAHSRLGAALATKDFKRDPGGSWKQNALRHTKGNKGLNYIFKAYKRQWKRLD